MDLSKVMKAAMRKRGFTWRGGEWRKSCGAGEAPWVLKAWQAGAIMTLPLDSLPLLLVLPTVEHQKVLWSLEISARDPWVEHVLLPILEARLEAGV
jgi:hypothetical protein